MGIVIAKPGTSGNTRAFCLPCEGGSCIAAEAREFGRLVASDDGRADIDRFLARRSLPLRRD
jgi:hypothetical protein